MPGRKNNHHSNNVEDCAVLLPSHGGQWDDMICAGFTVYNGTHNHSGMEVNPFICEYSKYFV